MGLVSTKRRTGFLDDGAGTAAITVFVGICAILFGLIATTGSPVMIALAVGLVGGIYLLTNPKLSVWIVLLAGLGSGALISIAGPQFSRLTWGVVIVCFLLWIPAVFAMLNKPRLPPFLQTLLVFLVISVLASVAQAHSFAEFIAGFKRYFQAYGLLFAMALLAFSERDFRHWRLLLACIALVQLPFAVYERFVLVPLRAQRGAEATDVVAGTFGANLEGGSPNSLMVLFLLIAVAFAYMRWREGQMSGRKALLFSLPCLAPIFLGETKIVLVLIPLMLLALHRRELVRRPGLFLFVLAAGAGLVAVLAYVYTALLWERPMEDVIRETLAYNFQYKGHGSNFLNRSTVLTFWWEQQSLADPIGFLFGHGIGSAYTGALSISVGHIAARYAGYGIDLTAASLLLWELGLVGLILHLSIFGFAWLAAGRLVANARNAAIRADATAIQAAIAAFVLFHFYSNSIVALLSGEILVAAVLGYLAYLLRAEAECA